MSTRIAFLHSIMDASGVPANPTIDARVAELSAAWKLAFQERNDAESRLADVSAELREEHRRLLELGVMKDDLRAEIDKMRPVYDAALTWVRIQDQQESEFGSSGDDLDSADDALREVVRIARGIQ